MPSALRKLLAGLATGFAGGAALAWYLTRYEPVGPGALADLRRSAAGERELLDRISPARLRSDTTALAAIGPRRGGTAGEVEARAWVVERFRAAGLSRVHLSPVVYPRWQRLARSELTFFTPAPYDPDFIVLYGSRATPAGGLERPVIDLGRGSETDYAVRSGRGLHGAVHLITHDGQPRRDLVLRATRHGAAAVVLAHGKPSPPGMALIENGTGVTVTGRIPALAVSYETGQRLRAKLAKGPVRALMHVNVGYRPGATANVIGTLPGRVGEYVVLAAHYDAWYAGAADNAAGVACLLELARTWVAAGLRPYRTIRFVSYAAEEEGLMGSIFDVFTRAPLVKARCRGVVTPDVVGVPGGSLRLRGLPPDLGQLAADLAAAWGYKEATRYPVTTGDAPTYADHWPYAQLRLPALVVSKGPDPLYHTPYDTAERLDYEDLRWTAALAGAVALRLAQR